MNPIVEKLALARRRHILEHLALADGHELGADVLAELVSEANHHAWRDVVESDITLLTQHSLVVVEELPSMLGPQKSVTLTGLGLDVARGRPHPIVAVKLPSY